MAPRNEVRLTVEVNDASGWLEVNKFIVDTLKLTNMPIRVDVSIANRNPGTEGQ
jgi:hypothetical protein